jgi:hypothetical protein
VIEIARQIDHLYVINHKKRIVMRNSNGSAVAVTISESPFSDDTMRIGVAAEAEHTERENFSIDYEGPFSRTYLEGGRGNTAQAESYVELLAELNQHDFSESLYAVANEIEDTIISKFSGEASYNGEYTQYVQRRSNEYFAPLINEVHGAIDQVNNYLVQNEFRSESDIDHFLQEVEFDHAGQLTPAQEQLFESFWGKIKSAVKKATSVAKKVVDVAKKFSPIHLALNKLKGLIKPLLNKVLNSLMGKVPQNLRPYAEMVAKKLVNMEVSLSEGEDVAGTDFEFLQRELDLNIANLVFSNDEMSGEEILSHYSYDESEVSRRPGKYATIKHARRSFIKKLKEGREVGPAMEEFLPALYPALKIGISLVGRKRVIDFLAGLLSKLVEKYVPANMAKPLSASIVDLGLGAMGFETAEREDDTLAYEAIASTVEEVVNTLAKDPELQNSENFSEQEAMDLIAERALPAFNKSVANNFPGTYIKKSLQLTQQPGVWIQMPRRGGEPCYKKYGKVFSMVLTPQLVDSLKTFGGSPLGQFMKDTLSIDLSRSPQVRVHIYEATANTTLSKISLYERVPGLGSANKTSWIQLHPLTVDAATALLQEPALGKNVGDTYSQSHQKITPGQRFFYMEIPGVSVRRPMVVRKRSRRKRTTDEQIVARTSDIQVVFNFLKAEVMVNYFFSEVSADQAVEKINSGDWIGAAESIRISLRETLHNILLKNVGSKVKIVHESVPELYLQHIPESEEFMGSIGKIALEKLVEKLTEKFVDAAYDGVKGFFKARVGEFKDALSKPDDGVTIQIIWQNVPGMTQLRSVIALIRGEGSIGDLANISMPTLPLPTLKIVAGKNFV